MKSKERRRRDSMLTAIAIVIIGVLLFLANMFMDNYQLRILNLSGIYIILSLSMILINGFLGLFSLGHAGFMAIGAYTVALLTTPPMAKQMNYYLDPIVPWLAETEWSFLPAILLGGVLAAIAGFLIGAPVLRLRDDYLAIATLGFAEIIRIVFTNLQSVTNGSLGLKGLPEIEIEIPLPLIGFTLNLSACIWIAAIITILFMVRLVNGSYGKAFKAIREDEIAAEAMGINVFKHKLLAFVIASFFAGVGGAFLGNIMGTVDPLMFRFLLTYNIVLIVVFGGIGSLTGGVLAAIVITAAMELLRFLDSSFDMGPIAVSGIPGLRMVVFSLLLMFIIIFKPRGIMGVREFSWQWLIELPQSIKNSSFGRKKLRKDVSK
ncbi:MAG: branched-chain amino acid ABC transporter permease [Eubacteriales bacterium]|nr:branched-chain amino acid ABC transporter permease [Eubacteriales bacterium]